MRRKTRRQAGYMKRQRKKYERERLEESERHKRRIRLILWTKCVHRENKGWKRENKL